MVYYIVLLMGNSGWTCNDVCRLIETIAFTVMGDSFADFEWYKYFPKIIMMKVFLKFIMIKKNEISL